MEKLSHDEQVRLARLALLAAARRQEDGASYRTAPVGSLELASDEDLLSWDADGWEEFSETR